jgi:hypothetical protein
MAPEFCPALNQTLQPEANAAGTKFVTSQSNWTGEDLEESARNLGNQSLGPEDLG